MLAFIIEEEASSEKAYVSPEQLASHRIVRSETVFPVTNLDAIKLSFLISGFTVLDEIEGLPDSAFGHTKDEWRVAALTLAKKLACVQIPVRLQALRDGAFKRVFGLRMGDTFSPKLYIPEVHSVFAAAMEQKPKLEHLAALIAGHNSLQHFGERPEAVSRIVFMAEYLAEEDTISETDLAEIKAKLEDSDKPNLSPTAEGLNQMRHLAR